MDPMGLWDPWAHEPTGPTCPYGPKMDQIFGVREGYPPTKQKSKKLHLPGRVNIEFDWAKYALANNPSTCRLEMPMDPFKGQNRRIPEYGK